MRRPAPARGALAADSAAVQATLLSSLHPCSPPPYQLRGLQRQALIAASESHSHSPNAVASPPQWQDAAELALLSRSWPDHAMFTQGLHARACGRGAVVPRLPHPTDTLRRCAVCLCPHAATRHAALLPCAHIFHMACLLALRRYATAAAACCPLCRAAAPSYAASDVAAMVARHVAATRCASAVKGLLARRAAYRLRCERYIIGGEAGAPPAFLAAALREARAGMCRSSADRQRGVSALLAQLDARASERTVLVDKRHHRAEQSWMVVGGAVMTEPAGAGRALLNATGGVWDEAVDLAVRRGHLTAECAVCLAVVVAARGVWDSAGAIVVRAGSAVSMDAGSGGRCGRRACVLPCGHAFHAACIASVEAVHGWAGSEGVADTRCPLCRGGYTHRLVCGAGTGGAGGAV